MRLYHSNRLEVLAAELAALMGREPGDPLAAERIVVPHPTIGRWLALELARQLGISANVRFEQPAGFAWSIMRGAVPELSREQPFAPERLRWRIHDLLPGFARAPHGAAVRGYLADGDPRKRFELADRLARVFDRCLVYRPDWIREWERGAPPHWQARLWQALVDRGGASAGPGLEAGRAPAGGAGTPGHWVAAIDAFRNALAAGRRPPGPPQTPPRDGPPPGAGASGGPRGETGRIGWPRRAIFFAVSALSPSYLQMLYEAGREIELHLFLLNPCREYWGDIRSRRELDRRAGGSDPGEHYFTEGNELLAAWGRAGRDTFDAFVEIASAGFEERFEAAQGRHRLAAVQRDLLVLRPAREGAKESRASTTDGTAGSAAGRVDGSIQIHVCHSPVREAEVLHDRLLRLFDDHDDLEPADVLVLTPALEVYRPALHAVFGAAGRIPLTAGRSGGEGQSPTMRAFLGLLDLPGSRLGAEAVLAPLDAPAVRNRFGIGAGDPPAIRGLVRAAGIRWGADEAHRGAEGLPETAGHTWRQGLRRLLLGHAMPDADTLVAGIVPCPAEAAAAGEFGAVEADGELVGRFVSYCEAVFGLRTRMEGERPPAAWADALHGLIRDFFAEDPAPGGRAGGPGGTGGYGDWRTADDVIDEIQAVRALVRACAREAEPAGSPVPFPIVRDVLRERAGAQGREPARLGDGVTVTALAPGRIFPAQVVCVLGMNDGAFPRSPSFPSFDLVAEGPARRGDRDVRHEDRFAFLEALLAARRCFLVTYTGRGLRDDAPIPPSVLVDEWKDYLGRRFPGAVWQTRHPLQPFNPRYFSALPAGEPPGDAAARRPPGPAADDDGLFSYSAGMCEAARAMLAGGAGPGRSGRFSDPLPEPDESRRLVDLADLVSFFANPARSFLRDRVGLRLEVADAALVEEEPFDIDALERFRLRSELLARIRAEGEPERTKALLEGSGRLPQAGPGQIVYEREREAAEGLDEQLAGHRPALEAGPIELDFEVGGFRIVGALEHVGPDGTMVWWRPGRLRARDRIGIWLRLLAGAAAGRGELEATGISRERSAWKSEHFPAPSRASAQLERWLSAWWQGLGAPLPFFPEASYAYARELARPGARTGAAARSAARARAQAVWSGSGFQPGSGEGNDPYLRLVHDGDAPLTGEFEDLAVELLAPLIDSPPGAPAAAAGGRTHGG